MAAEERYVVVEEEGYCYHTFYPRSFIEKQIEAFDLECPKCGEQRIKIIEEFEGDSALNKGDLARCWTCKHEFRVTENCWTWRNLAK